MMISGMELNLPIARNDSAMVFGAYGVKSRTITLNLTSSVMPRCGGTRDMLNSIESYAEAGRKAGIARNQHDESRARFETDYFRRMCALEKPADKAAARQAFDAAYRAARGA